ncbi:MAG: FkbM family methyltransferase [Planctomycetota bacterium]
MDLTRLRSALRHLDRAPELAACRAQTRQWPVLAAAYLGIAQPSYPYLLRLRDGRSLELAEPGDLVTAWVILFRGEYRVPPGAKMILDVGANIGAFTLFAAAAAPEARIHALEPFPSTFRHLELTVARNALVTRVRCHRLALAAAPGERRMSPGDLPSHKRALVGNGRGEAVEALTLGGFLEREGIEVVDLLKLDVEGEEHALLLDTPDEVLERVRAVAMEYHPAAPKEPLFDKLAAAGLRLDDDRPIGPACGIAHWVR